jgi:LAS superfamily LD-carboxypeptidase LdcB
MSINEAILGRDDSQIDYISLEQPLHCHVVPAVIRLKQKAIAQGVNLTLASGYRSFTRQLAIWNQKASGERVVLDSGERPIERSSMSPREIMFAILRWSALPGASRHHWGSDFDVFDANALPEGYKLQLNVKESAENGVFSSLYAWLDTYLVNEQSDFFRPYAIDSGGIAPEPWHLSYAPLACVFNSRLSVEVLLACIESCEIAFKNEIIANIDEIYDRYVFSNRNT